jgi:hypothetical protein
MCFNVEYLDLSRLISTHELVHPDIINCLGLFIAPKFLSLNTYSTLYKSPHYYTLLLFFTTTTTTTTTITQ